MAGAKDGLDWFQIIDTLAHEYGWTVEYIQALDIEEINNLLRKINERKKLEWMVETYIINCAFAGKKPNFDNKEQAKVVPANEIDALKRLMKAIGGKVEEIK
jgi:hypothetical protein